MIALLDTSEELSVCEEELGCPVNQLVTPLTRFTRQRPEDPFAVENGMFSKEGTIDKWLSLLGRERQAKSRCLWITLPDVVASARRTLESFHIWRYRPEVSGWKLALVAQDGLEDLDIPWEAIECVFIGGSTEWKMSNSAADVVRCGKILQKWVHVGRINTPDRWDYFEELGADSCDGSGISRYSWMRTAIRDRKNHAPLPLFDQSETHSVEAHA
jgi:hypothetical protein